MEKKENHEQLMVTIRCITYNHEPYIRQCLEGIVMQKTNFRFEAVVHDDASTDGTAEIVREYAVKYPNIIKPIYETENQYSKHDGSIRRILDKNTYGKYIAMCEGDDYWIDPFKLQKQVDFMELNPDYGAIYSKSLQYLQNEGKYSKGYLGEECKNIKDLYKSNKIPTLTVLYRTSFRKSYQAEILNSPITNEWKMGDYPLWLFIRENSKIKYLSECMTVYRTLNNSASHFDNIDHTLCFQKNAYQIKNFFICKYNRNNFKKIIDKEFVKKVFYFCSVYNLPCNYPINFLRNENLWSVKYYNFAFLYIIRKVRLRLIK